MKDLFNSFPVISFLLITFAITFSTWFSPVFLDLPVDIAFAMMLLGGCGPLLAGYIIRVVQSQTTFRVRSWPVFIAVFVGSLFVLGMRLYLIDHGMSDVNGRIPKMEEVSTLGYGLFVLMAIVLAWNASNWNNPNIKENYLTSFLFQKKALPWYLIALGLQPIFSVVSYLAGRVLGFELSGELVFIDGMWFVGLLSTFFFFGGNEEFGWRGFMQLELQKKYSPLVTILVVSFFWSIWHLPHYYNGFYSTAGFMEMLPRFFWTIPLTVVIHWVYNNSNYSMLAVVLLHTMNNNFGRGFGSSGKIYVGLLFLFCLYLIVRDRMWLSRPSQLPS
ncbi:CPBP family intramembrane glutamic endopeptidase [Aureicoccus marinus]|uniref:CAAX prenyl protease 2/Lysostaphin resistance protein A-like domain-containing protein n=1 Tax=Aureicoccus marinus TaxID=754435 RepID=A0A2S7TAF3_9FLAO|nr:CPBP family intramembrane glutamic endopeptidase [Aureicoccus marinus]PQJ16541.1 hypothetical protein BST99_13170 [Aureicoccus marinus]